jgi:hypothetical protein
MSQNLFFKDFEKGTIQGLRGRINDISESACITYEHILPEGYRHQPWKQLSASNQERIRTAINKDCGFLEGKLIQYVEDKDVKGVPYLMLKKTEDINFYVSAEHYKNK